MNGKREGPLRFSNGDVFSAGQPFCEEGLRKRNAGMELLSFFRVHCGVI